MKKFEKIISVVLTLTIICGAFSPLIALAADDANTVEITAEKGETYSGTIVSVSAKATKASGKLSNIKGNSKLLGVVGDLKTVISSDVNGQYFGLEFTAKRSGTAELDYEFEYSLNGKSTTGKRHVVIMVINKKIEDIKSSVSDATANVTDKATDIAGKAADKASDLAGKAADKANDIAGKAADKATEYAGKAGELAASAKDSVVTWYDSLDLSAFENGWDYFQKIAGMGASTVLSKQYVENVKIAISQAKIDINDSYNSARGVAQEAGFIAEKWAADTFNIDAVASGSKERAWTVNSNGTGSVDVATSYHENAQLKYYKTSNESASQQAKSILDRYNEYAKNSKNPKELTEWLDESGYDKATQDELLKGLYDGMTRIIPAEQLDDAVKYLQGKIDAADLPADKARYKETLDHLKTRLEAPDGTASKEITNEELQAITELAQNGDFKPEDFGLKVSQVITPKYIVKQSINAGLQAGAISAVLAIVPDLYNIIVQAAKDGEIDPELLKEAGIDAAISGSEGFLIGSISSALTIACQSGMLGEGLSDISAEMLPNVVSVLVVVSIDAIRYGYSLSKGEITTDDYGNLMAEEVFTCAVGTATGALFQYYLPALPCAYMLGSFIGSMLATMGYEFVDGFVLEIKNAGGFEAVLPAGVADTIDAAKESLQEIGIGEWVSNAKAVVVSTTKEGYITLSSAVKNKIKK